MTSGRRFLSPVFLVFVGTLLLQAAWILAVPPFRGSDEFDHAYRADSVANGNWAASTETVEQGRGGVVVVRSSIVDAAGEICSWYKYTGHYNCYPVDELGHGSVTVASGASGYHPAYYFAIGTPARFAEGATALLIMRIVSATLCSLMIALAVHLVSLASGSPWPTGALLTGLTPVLVYSTAIAAPNGLEMAAGAATWGGLLALGCGRLPESRERSVLAWLTIAATVLATLRQLGPLWLAMILVVCAVVFGMKTWADVMRRHRLPASIAVVVTTAGVVASVAWVKASQTLVQGERLDYPSPFLTSLTEIPLWTMQSIAAFPLRNEPAPTVVYAVYGLIGLVALAVGVRWGSPRLRAGIVLSSLLSLAIPFVITWATIDTAGRVWQGRYGLPFSVGLLVLCSLSAVRHERRRHWPVGPVLLAVWLSVLLSHLVSVVSVFDKELTNPATNSGAAWPVIDAWALGILVILALTLWLMALLAGKEDQAILRATTHLTQSANKRGVRALD